MLSIPDLKQLEDRMRPGAMSLHGFLGVNESLENVLEEDDKVLKNWGLTHTQLADELEAILSIAIGKKSENIKDWFIKKTPYPNLYEPLSLPKFSIDNMPSDDKGYMIGKLHVFIKSWRGVQECPWGCIIHPDWASIDFMILNRESGEFFTGPGLAVHLIREHHFFEGKGTSFRVDPAKAIRVLEIPANTCNG